METVHKDSALSIRRTLFIKWRNKEQNNRNNQHNKPKNTGNTLNLAKCFNLF